MESSSPPSSMFSTPQHQSKSISQTERSTQNYQNDDSISHRIVTEENEGSRKRKWVEAVSAEDEPWKKVSSPVFIYFNSISLSDNPLSLGVDRVRDIGKGCEFVQFGVKSDAEEASSKLNGSIVGTKTDQEAKLCKRNIIWSGKSAQYTKFLSFDSLQQHPNAKYLHNEPIHDVEFSDITSQIACSVFSSFVFFDELLKSIAGLSPFEKKGIGDFDLQSNWILVEYKVFDKIIGRNSIVDFHGSSNILWLTKVEAASLTKKNGLFNWLKFRQREGGTVTLESISGNSIHSKGCFQTSCNRFPDVEELAALGASRFNAEPFNGIVETGNQSTEWDGRKSTTTRKVAQPGEMGALETRINYEPIGGVSRMSIDRVCVQRNISGAFSFGSFCESNVSYSSSSINPIASAAMNVHKAKFWTHNGVIEDPCREISIADDKSLQNESLIQDYDAKYWKQSCSLKDEILSFLARTAATILTTIRYLNVIQEWGQNIQVVIIENEKLTSFELNHHCIECIEAAYDFALAQKGHYNEKEAAKFIKTIVSIAEACYSLGPGETFSDMVRCPYYVASEVLRKCYGIKIDVWVLELMLKHCCLRVGSSNRLCFKFGSVHHGHRLDRTLRTRFF